MEGFAISDPGKKTKIRFFGHNLVVEGTPPTIRWEFDMPGHRVRPDPLRTVLTRPWPEVGESEASSLTPTVLGFTATILRMATDTHCLLQSLAKLYSSLQEGTILECRACCRLIWACLRKRLLSPEASPAKNLRYMIFQLPHQTLEETALQTWFHRSAPVRTLRRVREFKQGRQVPLWEII